ncbi:hypothetical protein WN51_10203 [Melipona quadrifasciata]|uniref:Uncharacterized protein n=1 Tax=Melipona quadrifasciata TaxID=166423 RepID=A0A0N0BJJ1_9HYME|nr:hypothetical protein WN51_10203 [Melipona quadrifasciata]
MFYNITMNEDALFKTLDLPRWERPRKFNNIELTPLYKNVRPIATLKYNDVMDLLHCILPVHYNYFKSLPHTQIG